MFAVRHVPAAQVEPVAHTFPHAPQLSGSVWVLIDAAHDAQRPATHAVPLQRSPHAPQLFESVAVLVHAPPHTV